MTSGPAQRPPLPSQTQFQAAQAQAGRARNGAVAACSAPRISVNWINHDFGRVKKGDAFPQRELVITSTGTAPLVIASIQVNSAEYRLDHAAAAVLVPGATLSVPVHFEPTGYGLKNAQVQITSNAGNQDPVAVSVSGKLYSVMTLLVLDEPGGAARAEVMFKIQQTGQPERELRTDAQGRIALETEFDGAFTVNASGHDAMIELHAVATR